MNTGQGVSQLQIATFSSRPATHRRDCEAVECQLRCRFIETPVHRSVLKLQWFQGRISLPELPSVIGTRPVKTCSANSIGFHAIHSRIKFKIHSLGFESPAEKQLQTFKPANLRSSITPYMFLHVCRGHHKFSLV